MEPCVRSTLGSGHVLLNEQTKSYFDVSFYHSSKIVDVEQGKLVVTGTFGKKQLITAIKHSEFLVDAKLWGSQRGSKNWRIQLENQFKDMVTGESSKGDGKGKKIVDLDLSDEEVLDDDGLGRWVGRNISKRLNCMKRECQGGDEYNSANSSRICKKQESRMSR
ncbi:hypothetical protein D8674_027867 [Pyrus ussuriensis x Pyrus communis]|uniref:Uncharacterized protein n=1 Tax=Pyrus ussuriensis x Pyrus communis TaxID=2448454 RepID=A0A5N5IE08_9ROSA|nr:hypothetical protein D8674_027867 [Pyrus ussuriensis x Pyrus communis]